MKTFFEFITEARGLTPARMRAAQTRIRGNQENYPSPRIELADTKTNVNKTVPTTFFNQTITAK